MIMGSAMARTPTIKIKTVNEAMETFRTSFRERRRGTVSRNS
jgi:hypothetical protein